MYKITNILRKVGTFIRRSVFKARGSENVHDIRRSTKRQGYVGNFLIRYLSGLEEEEK